MNDQQFLERAHANVHDDSQEFLEATAASPERQQLVDELKSLDASLKAGLEAVTAPAHLKQKLLDIPEGELHPDTEIAAANDSFWRRNAQYAAGLIFAVGVLAIMFQGNGSSMENMVFNHIYSELVFLEDDTPLALDDVNNLMNTLVGSTFRQSPEMENVEIDVTQDCWLDPENGIQGVHLVMKGSMGQVTVMVIPNEPIAEEVAISDSRFDGMITPTPSGNLVVVGEKSESIQQFSNMLAANINW